MPARRKKCGSSADGDLVPTYQCVFRFADRDAVQLVEHDALSVGARLEVDGATWIVVEVVRLPRWENVKRVILRQAGGNGASSTP